mmetsp:Transcript_12708/g.40133  ORF Transcript_12708/g.40133 Transcript_12708/m.40133 type:complete len:216 (+) Transcript_12708:438-1085(+)
MVAWLTPPGTPSLSCSLVIPSAGWGLGRPRGGWGTSPLRPASTRQRNPPAPPPPPHMPQFSACVCQLPPPFALLFLPSNTGHPPPMHSLTLSSARAARRVLCACMSAGSTALLLAAVAGATSSLPAGAAAAALAAFSPLLASHAATPEVFPLNQLLAAAMLLCATRFARQVRLPKPNTESRPAAAPSCGKGGALLARRGARVTRAGRHTYSWAFP